MLHNEFNRLSFEKQFSDSEWWTKIMIKSGAQWNWSLCLSEISIESYHSRQRKSGPASLTAVAGTVRRALEYPEDKCISAMHDYVCWLISETGSWVPACLRCDEGSVKPTVLMQSDPPLQICPLPQSDPGETAVEARHTPSWIDVPSIIHIITFFQAL